MVPLTQGKEGGPELPLMLLFVFQSTVMSSLGFTNDVLTHSLKPLLNLGPFIPIVAA